VKFLPITSRFLVLTIQNRGMQFNTVKQNKWVLRTLWALAGVLALWGMAWLVVPGVLKGQLEARASAQLGRQVTLGALDFKPWSLELTLHQLAVARAAGVDEKSPQLLIKRIYIDAELQSLLRMAPVLDAFEVEAPQLSLTYLGGGHYDVDDVLARVTQPADKPAAEPVRFALHNLVLTGGSLDFSDTVLKQTHALRELQIKLPFLSNLTSQREVQVQPKLAFRLNGSTFDSSAQGTPFAQTRKMEATLKVAALDLTPYLGYLSASLPVKLSSGVLTADLKVAFEQSPAPSVKLSGSLQAGQVKLTGGASGAPDLLGFDVLKLDLTDVRPLEKVALLASVELKGPRLNVVRSKTGQLNLTTLLRPSSAPGKIAGDLDSVRAKGINDDKSAAWKVGVAQLRLQGGMVNWQDEGTVPAARLELSELELNAIGMALPMVQPLQFEGAAQLASHAGTQDKPARFNFKGSATAQQAHVTAGVTDLSLSLAAPYLTTHLTPALGGWLNAELGIDWKASTDPARASELLLASPRLTLESAALTQGKTRLASIQKLQLEQLQVDVSQQRVTLGQLSVTQPKANVAREADGRWMFERWLKNGSVAPAAGKSVVQSGQPVVPAAPWRIDIQNAALTGGAVAFADKSVAKPVAFDLAAISGHVKNFSSAGRSPFAATVGLQIRTARGDAGRLLWRGSAGLAPLNVQGKVEVVRLPVHAFEPYLADALNIELLKAEASFKGQVAYQQTAVGPLLKLSGDSTIEEFRANSAPAPGSALSAAQPVGEELLHWKLLSLRGVDLALAPGKATTVAVQETVLSDFFARLILSESGRLNLQDVLKKPVVPSAPELIAAGAVNTGAGGQNDASAALAPVISFGPVSLVGGRVHFSDRFIKPNYSANLTELTGKLSAFSSVTTPGVLNLAELELRGRAEGTASLEILGKVNPLVTPLALDIKGRVRDLELPPLSPYSVRYAGHGIERGKLSVDVGYVVQPDGQLTASNNIVLNQITFGDKVEGAPASLPVKLAVALLADRDGVIDLNLPISGSLNDPQFKVGPIVFKLIVNLVVKAITSPFSLLAHAFGGGTDELSMVSFAPGSAVLGADAKSGLDKVAQALVARPALTMTVVGTASLAVEREAFKRAQLNALVLAEKRRAAIVNGARATEQSPAEEAGSVELGVVASDYAVLLKALYRRADFPKPRNLIGLLKDIPQAEMEALLLANLPATEESMRELAVQRGVAVRDYLAAQKLPLERLFLGAAKAQPTEEKWNPRAELNLTMQ
jgi:hypothetical protein